MVKALGALWRLPCLCKALFLTPFLLFLPLPGYTLVELESPSRKTFFLLREGEAVQLTWKNSLFGQQVTEHFVVRDGILWLEEVNFDDKTSGYTMVATPEDLLDLYHTGGGFGIKGVKKPFRQIIFLIGAIGNPRLKIKGQELNFQEEASFGGKVTLGVKKAKPINLLLASARALVHRLLFWLSSSHPGAP
ncbi:MAG: DUF1850 domain-containing protein [Anaerolineae bacterium]|nr:DUF1850 domain-containing protein [Anaerolineae bacterium]MDW8103160.1 DUF1850 domain-containing protein [Anaerolineae bacterium]